MTIKLDNVELDCYDFEETNEGKKFSFKVDVQSEKEKDSLIKLLTKKFLTLTKENGETLKVNVQNNSHNFSLRDGQMEPDKYHFSINLEKFDEEAEIDGGLKRLDAENGIAIDASISARVIRELLVEKGILTSKEFLARFDAVSKEIHEAARKGAEKELDKKFES